MVFNLIQFGVEVEVEVDCVQSSDGCGCGCGEKYSSSVFWCLSGVEWSLRVCFLIGWIA